MLSSAQKSVPTTKQFRQPYFMDIAPDGTILSTCARFATLLDKQNIPDFLGGNFLEIFSRLGKIESSFTPDLLRSGLPGTLDLLIQRPGAKPFVIRWIPAPHYAMEINAEGWQLTGTKVYSEIFPLSDLPESRRPSDILIATDPEGKIAYWNMEAEKFFHITSEEAIGQPLAELVRFGYINTSEEEVNKILLERDIWEGETTYVSRAGKKSYLITAIRYIRDKDRRITGIMAFSKDITEIRLVEQQSDSNIGRSFHQAFKNKMTVTVEQYYERSASWLEMSLYPSHQGMFAYFRDVTLRKKQDALLALEKKVLVLNTGKRLPLQALLNFFLKGIQDIFPGMYCMVMTLDEDTLSVRLLSAPGIPAIYAHAVDGLPIGPHSGSCGTAMYRKETVIVSDIATDPLWVDYRDLALQFGLRACWSIPVVNDRDEVLAAFSVYYTTAKTPTDAEMDLFERVANLVTIIMESKKIEEKLLQQELNKHKLLAQAMVDAQEKERAEIGKELHDNINQILSTTKLYLELAKSDNKERLSLINRSAGNIHNAIREIRNISRSLVPASIGDLGLLDSLIDLVESIQLTRALRVEFYPMGNFDERLNDKTKLMLFRIIQEQVNNVLKHSGARKLVIELILEETENRIELSMTDDGKGFNPERVSKKGLGLSNIRSRADLFGGKVTIQSAPGRGCKLRVQVPV